MKLAVLTANLGGFDKNVEYCPQHLPHGVEVTGHRFTDKNFPPCVGYTPRFQYRIPKMFGWEMFPGYDVYLWLDGSMSLQYPGSVTWFLEKLGDADIAVFKHPWRNTIKKEVDHIEDHLQKGKPYITSRYKGGLHKEQYEVIKSDKSYKDDCLYTSTSFIYRNTKKVQIGLTAWWTMQSRYFTCDQVSMAYVLRKCNLDIKVINENQYKIPYLSMTSPHK